MEDDYMTDEEKEKLFDEILNEIKQEEQAVKNKLDLFRKNLKPCKFCKGKMRFWENDERIQLQCTQCGIEINLPIYFKKDFTLRTLTGIATIEKLLIQGDFYADK